MSQSMRHRARLAAGFLFLSALFTSPVAGQLTLPEDRGVVGVGLLLRQLDGEKRVLMIGAHPDDEDTGILTALARGQGARTAYLSLTRGEGGQNLIGPELDEGLGIIRSGELEAARRLDGGVQFFTRAFDFGFSKTSDETFGYWPREELLRDAVEVVRRFRPHLIISVFSGTPRDGHGHHQVAGMIATEAFEVAGDPARFPDQIEAGLEAWTPAHLYQRFRGIPGGEAIPVPTGIFDPLLGRSHFQLAMDSRSQHRSQDMGAGQTPGPRESTLVRVASAAGLSLEGSSGLFAGVDTTLTGLTRGLPSDAAERVRGELERYRGHLRAASTSLDALDPSRAAPELAAALARVRSARDAAGAGSPSGLRSALAEREAGLTRALLAAAGIAVEVRALEEVVVPGTSVGVEVILWNGGPFTLHGAEGLLQLPAGWLSGASTVAGSMVGGGGPMGEAPGSPTQGPLAPGELRRWSWTVQVPSAAEPSRLFYLAEAMDGEMYRWPADGALRGRPRNPAPVGARTTFGLELGAERVSLQAEGTARYVGVDKALGEFTRPLLVLPALSVATEPRVLAWPQGDAAERPVTVRVRSQSADALRGSISLEVPAGWQVEPREHAFDFEGAGAERAFVFRVRAPAGTPGMATLRAVARTSAGSSYDEGFTLIDYPHIERTPLFQPAQIRVSTFPVAVREGLRVGYVMGSGDDGAEALRQVGASVELLTPDQLMAGGLERFDAIVLGVRVYEVLPSMFPATEALLAFARAGGTVVAQYNKYEYPDGNVAPYPVRMARPHDRVTDEAAEVTLLDPASPVFRGPNAIGDTDFEGWVQERGLYFLSEWDPRFVPLLSMADPGEAPKRGSLVVAPVGEGLYIYTGLAFFRQFPEGVPGAYRLLANLASLRAADWHAHHGTAPEEDR